MVNSLPLGENLKKKPYLCRFRGQMAFRAQAARLMTVAGFRAAQRASEDVPRIHGRRLGGFDRLYLRMNLEEVGSRKLSVFPSVDHRKSKTRTISHPDPSSSRAVAEMARNRRVLECVRTVG